MSSPVKRIPPKPAHSPRDATSRSLIREQASNELIFAVVGHVGSGTSEISEKLRDALENPSLKGGRYDVTIMKARDVIVAWAKSHGIELPPGVLKDERGGKESKVLQTTITLQDLGDEMRKGGDHAAVASALVARIRATRGKKQKSKVSEGEPVIPDGARRAYILDSIRHPAEVHLLRSVYQSAFTLFGIVCEEDVRLKRIMKKYSNAGEEFARQFMERDAHAKELYGQHVSDAFHLADVFIDNTQPQFLKNGLSNVYWTIPDQLSRIVKLITHVEIVRPTAAESAMYAAYGAKLRSSCLSRQVGAAVADFTGTVVSTGTNETPCAGGGVCLEPTPGKAPNNDGRCAFRPGEKFCSNTREQNELIEEIFSIIPNSGDLSARKNQEKQLRDGRIGYFTEYSRAVHAEMDAILSAARRGVPVSGTTLYVTTFPCHYCAKHLVSAGIDEVQFIEPYPKSKALKLFSDSITMDLDKWAPPSKGGVQVLFRPYTGVAPRTYERAFLKNRALKDAVSGNHIIGDPDWGSAWDLVKVSYPQLEVELTRKVGEPNVQSPSA